MQGEPLSTTSQRTFRARQQQQALEALLLTGRLRVGAPAVEALRLVCGSGGGELVLLWAVMMRLEFVEGIAMSI